MRRIVNRRCYRRLAPNRSANASKNARLRPVFLKTESALELGDSSCREDLVLSAYFTQTALLRQSETTHLADSTLCWQSSQHAWTPLCGQALYSLMHPR